MTLSGLSFSCSLSFSPHTTKLASKAIRDRQVTACTDQHHNNYGPKNTYCVPVVGTCAYYSEHEIQLAAQTLQLTWKSTDKEYKQIERQSFHNGSDHLLPSVSFRELSCTSATQDVLLKIPLRFFHGWIQCMHKQVSMQLVLYITYSF